MPCDCRPIWLFAAGWLIVGSTQADARPPHKLALAEYFGPHISRALVDCKTCHIAGSDAAEDRPHNPFGARLKEVKADLQLARKSTGIAARLEAIADEDSDGDGVSNVIELLSGHQPGDPGDKPNALEIAQAREKLTAFRLYQRRYPWRPFEEVRKPAIPADPDSHAMGNPIDAFLTQERRARGLTCRPPADKATLLRRVSLDLTGLPPSRAELHAFLADASPGAYEQVVDRLLASPHYGERWGRHWMDIWRYSDWAGYGMEVRDSQPFIWHWRDWIVEALNRDRGHDRMILEMLAGDELAPQDQETLRATGFLARNWHKFDRDTWLQNTIEHTAKAFLGVTLNCARCHDHMYDPIDQEEYYRFRAFFEPHDVRTDRRPGTVDTKADGLVRVYDAHPDRPTYLFVRGDEKQPKKDKPLAPAIPAALGGRGLVLMPVTLAPAALAAAPPPAKGKAYPNFSTGRRLALANWIADSKNPLTARVAVNHIWMRHFGKALVPTVFDFGRNGRPPSHPALLDWLADAFMRSGWSHKTLHRLIVTSAAYRLDSMADQGSLARDPDNSTLWRMNPRRLEAEAVRDSILDAAGGLDHAIGGQEIMQQQGLEVPRRSIYFQHAAEKQMLFLTLFDGPSVVECYQRTESVLPQQALALANSSLVSEQAGRLAKALTWDCGRGDEAFVRAAFETILGRLPSAEEQASCLGFLREREEKVASPRAYRARHSLAQVLFNHHEFVTVR